MVDSQKRIAGAFLVGAFIVASAFFISRTVQSGQAQGALVVQPMERSPIEITDSNQDGIPDWQDAISNTEPIVVPTATSTYTEPTTVTGKFGVSFFEKYIRSNAFGIFGDSKEELVANATKELVKNSEDILFTKDNLTVFSSTDVPSLQMYGNHVATVLISHPNEGENEALILQDALRYNKPEKLEELKPIAKAYTDMVQEIIQTPVPSSYVQLHLNLANALNAVREDVNGMQKVNEDALYTFVRMKRYQDDVLGLSKAIEALFDTLYFTDNVRFNANDATLKLMQFEN